MRLHPQEALLQQSPAYDQYRQRRVVAEHRLARLVQLGIRQARYFGRAKTKFQLYLAATVANLTLLADKIRLTGDLGLETSAFTVIADAGVQNGTDLRRDRGAPTKTGFPSEFLGRTFISGALRVRC